MKKNQNLFFKKRHIVYTRFFVTIAEHWMNFKKYTTGISNMGTPYDYGSIMHYGKGSFSKSWFGRTITPKKSGVSIGQRKKLSPIDIKEANLYYNCKK